jgi:hypothetical protein
MSLIQKKDYSNIICSFQVGDSPVETIRQLMQEGQHDALLRKRPCKFIIAGPSRTGDALPWNDALFSSLFDLFIYFSEQMIFWEELEFCLDHGGIIPYHRYAKPLIFEANRLSLFRKLNLKITGYIDPPHLDDDEYYFPGIQLNHRLESLSLLMDGFAYEFTSGDLSALRHVLTTSKSLRNLSIQDFHGYQIPNLNHILKAVQNSDSLESLGMTICDGYSSRMLSTFVDLAVNHCTNLKKITAFNYDTTTINKEDLERLLSTAAVVFHNPILFEFKLGCSLPADLLPLLVALRWTHPKLWLDCDKNITSSLHFVNSFHVLRDMIPLNLWPQMLERAIHTGIPDQVLFDLLQSPSLLAILEPKTKPNWSPMPQDAQSHATSTHS